MSVTAALRTHDTPLNYSHVPDSHGGRLTGKRPVLGIVSFCLLGLLSMSHVMPTAAELQICAGVVRGYALGGPARSTAVPALSRVRCNMRSA